ncbi:MAG: hypothetical protein JKY45_04795 [Emcibacter sp.]|nr:hypothetical protein [Emcibacter sp.]
MAARKIHCIMLRQKLQSYYRHGFPVKYGLVHLNNNADLADALNISTGTLSNNLNGRNDGSEERLPPDHLDWLTDHFIMATEDRLSRTQVIDLWRHASVSAFEYHLRNKPPSGLMSILLEQKPSLTVNVGEAPVVVDLNMFEEPFDPLPDEHIIEVGRKICLEIQTRPDQCLVVLSKSPKDWFWLSPSPHHPGPTVGGLEIIPPGRGFGIEVRGTHTIIAIELEGQTPPFIRERGTPPAMKDHMERALEEELRSGRSWRWGESKFFAERPKDIAN